MSTLVFSGIAAIAGTTNQCLLARRAGFSNGENAIYNTVSAITTLITFVFFVTEVNDFYCRQTRYLKSDEAGTQKKEMLDKIKEERMPRDLVIGLLASHVLGWVAGSLASALFRYPSQHIGTTILMNASSFGISSLVVVASKVVCV